MILLDAEGNEIQRQLFTENELQNTGVIQKTLATSMTSKYIVKVIATYMQQLDLLVQLLAEQLFLVTQQVAHQLQLRIVLLK